jgi:hypothetical protein
MRKLSLHEISEQVSECLNKVYSDEWKTMDTILEQACSSLPSDDLRFLIPKVILIDRYYRTNLIKFDKEEKRDEDGDSVYGFTYYKAIAKGLRELRLDSKIEDIRGKAPRLCACNLEAVVRLCNDVSDVVKKSTGRAGIVFASKLLHFSAPDLFPILDSNAEKKLKDVFKELDDDAKGKIGEIRASVDKEILNSKLADRYRAFATDILCLQYALCLNGDPFYTFSELDKYLYGSRYLEETSP